MQDDRAWWQRRDRLEALGIDSPTWQVPRYFPGGDLTDVYEATKKLGLEGIVLKRTGAPYEPMRVWVMFCGHGDGAAGVEERTRAGRAGPATYR